MMSSPDFILQMSKGGFEGMVEPMFFLFKQY